LTLLAVTHNGFDGEIKINNTTKHVGSETDSYRNAVEAMLAAADGDTVVLAPGETLVGVKQNDGVTVVDSGHPSSLIEYVKNESGTNISKGKAVYVTGSGTYNRTVTLARADHPATSVTIGISLEEIANGDTGWIITRGPAIELDTSGFVDAGSFVYLSATDAGDMTSIAPTFPDYEIIVGTTMVVDATIGKISINPIADIQATTSNFFNGILREEFDFLVTSDGTDITGSLTDKYTSGSLTMMFSDGFTLLDVTDLSIQLIPGTDINPQQNFIYIPISTKLLTVNTSYPTGEHIKVANVILQSAATTVTDSALGNRNINDTLAGTDNQGHLTHMTSRMRKMPAHHDSGTEATLTGLPTNGYVQVTAGIVSQMHEQVFPAQSMPTDEIHIVNHDTTPYLSITDLKTLTLNALGDALLNSSFSLVLWAIANKSGEKSHIMLNLPTGGYSKNVPEDAVADAFNYSVYDIPNIFEGSAFLIARFTISSKSGSATVVRTPDAGTTVSPIAYCASSG